MTDIKKALDAIEEPQLIERRGSHYYLSAESKNAYPSVTTIQSAVINNAGGLMAWAARLTHEKFLKNQEEFPDSDPIDWLESAINESNRVRDKSAEIGTKFHAEMENRINGYAPTDHADIIEHLAFAEEFLNHNMIKPIAAERRIIQEATKTKPGYGGSIDLIGVHIPTNKICIIDWKTGNTKHDSHLTQIAAYAHALNDIIRVDGAFVVYTHRGEVSELPNKAAINKEYKKFTKLAGAYHALRKTSKVFNDA